MFHRCFRPVVIVGLSVALMWIVIPASAMTPVYPTSTEVPVKAHSTLQFDQLIVDCRDFGYDFSVADHTISNVTIMTFHDTTGSVTRRLWQDQGTDHFYKVGQPESILLSTTYNVMNYLAPIASDGATATLRAMGQPFRVRLPTRQAIHIAGQVTLVVDAAGNWLNVQRFVGMQMADYSALCTALAG